MSNYVPNNVKVTWTKVTHQVHCDTLTEEPNNYVVSNEVALARLKVRSDVVGVPDMNSESTRYKLTNGVYLTNDWRSGQWLETNPDYVEKQCNCEPKSEEIELVGGADTFITVKKEKV